MGDISRRRPVAAVVMGTNFQAAEGSRDKGRLIGHGWGQQAGRRKLLKRLPHLKVSTSV